MGEIYLNTSALAWESAEGYPSGAMQKVLHDGTDTTPRTVLLKIEPGFSMTEHSHLYTELHFILEGEYQIHDEVFPEGTFRIVPEHTNHGPFSTKKGAVILVVWIDYRK